MCLLAQDCYCVWKRGVLLCMNAGSVIVYVAGTVTGYKRGECVVSDASDQRPEAGARSACAELQLVTECARETQAGQWRGERQPVISVYLSKQFSDVFKPPLLWEI